MNSDDTPLIKWLRSAGHEADELLDFLKHQLRNHLDPDGPLEIITYRGFGNKDRSSLTGRILAYREPLNHAVETRWTNLQQSYRRFESDEIPNILVEATVAGQSYTATSDDEGYFALEFATPSLDNTSSFSVALDLPERISGYSAAQGRVYVPSSAAKFGVISDIDDTILKTNATSILQMMKLTLLESSRTRLAFSGVDTFYQALHQNINPFFYVSSSPWNLYDFLIDFMALNNLVEGPLLLRDFGLDKSKFIAGPHLQHKLNQIRKILLTYPDLPFILVGDSGQDDPEIYACIVREFPGRVHACYIRDVSDASRDKHVQAIINSLSSLSVDMLLVPDTAAAVVHAAARNWISPDALSANTVSTSNTLTSAC